MDSPVWLDMDPGIDDAWALIIASCALHVHGLSTVAGNVPVGMTYRNAQEVLGLLQRDDIPVYHGAPRPLLYEPLTAESYHGETGLGPWTPTTPPTTPQGPPVWLRWAQQTPVDPMDLVATGPLTNLALGYLTVPDFDARWSSVTVMCGAMPGVRADKHDEFNVYADPHAADVVFRRGHHVRVVGINVAHRAVLPLGDVDRLAGYGRVGRFLASAMRFYSQKARGEGGDPNAFPVDDLVAIAAVVAPDLFRWSEMPVTVVREGPMRGALLITPKDEDRPPVQIATEIDAVGFRDFVWDRMQVYRDG
ncbi:MAG: nucleoside hydrolase [Clostridia bacterium]